ncbi:hypothetical protein E2562_027480 [Oryza meyeriana var. granulata]|uniref:Uncharacterized protein n=1 Tax=Oryza meyeriana var. granulata TaxID=110450 RepID=A0A6G1E2C9_9ORYZ|nr:hypothetical protein E2562_027480 [Oryza meyeriana var. granulata]
MPRGNEQDTRRAGRQDEDITQENLPLRCAVAQEIITTQKIRQSSFLRVCALVLVMLCVASL